MSGVTSREGDWHPGALLQGATLLALYAGYETIGLAKMYGKLRIER
jgi:hypothetical protein